MEIKINKKRDYWALTTVEKAQTIGFYRQCGDMSIIAAIMNIDICDVKVVLEVYFAKNLLIT